MEKQKISGKFYPLQHEEWIKACKELSSGARDILYYIRTADPYSNGVEITAAAIALELGVNRSTVSRALKELDQKGYISLEILKAKVQILGGGLVAEIQLGCEIAPPVAKMQQDVQNCNEQCEIATNSAKLHQPSAKLQQTQPEMLTAQGLQDSKTNKDLDHTNKDLDQTLSEAAEREKNFQFFNSLSKKEQLALQQTAAKWYLPMLPKYPALPNKWIKRNAIEISQSDFYILELGKFSENSTEEEF